MNLNIKAKDIENLNKKGFVKIIIPKGLKQNLFNEINKKIKKNFLKGINSIARLSDEEFVKKFGHVSQRYFSKNTSIKFEKIIYNSFKKLNEKAFLHEPPKSDINFNKNLTKKNLSFYWRIVRQQKKDVGKPHTDEQFWKLLKKNDLKILKKYKEKLKIWIPLYGCNRNNSLRILSKNLSKKAKFKKINVNGILKPSVDDVWLSKNINKFKKLSNGKNAILFSYNTVHYGPTNYSNKTRISCEATILLEK